MRIVFFLILIINIVFAIVEYLNQAIPTPVPVQNTTITRELQLLSEAKQVENESSLNVEPKPILATPKSVDDKAPLLSSDESAQKTTKAIEPKIQTQPRKDPVRSCLKISGKVEAKQQQSLASNPQLTKESTGMEEYTRKRYWVYLDSYRNRASAESARKRLATAGIKDSFTVKRGDNKNAISLGLFSSRDSAQRIQKQVNNSNAQVKEAQIKEMDLTAERPWIIYSFENTEKEKIQSTMKQQNLQWSEIMCP